MAVARPDITALDPAAVATIQSDMTAKLQAAFPALDFRRGVYHDRVVYLAAVLAATEQGLVDAIQRSMSLKDIAADPALASSDLVDRVLSNFNVTRASGVAATGPLTIVVSSPAPLTIPPGMAFVAGDVAIATTQVTAVRASAGQVAASTDRVLAAQSDGTYAFTIPAVATAVGAAGNLRRGQQATPTQAPANFVKAYVPADWGGGADTETNAALIARLRAGIAAPVMSNRTNIAALIRADSRFSSIPALSIVGAGDAELARSRRGILPVALPGYCDIYARTAALPARTIVAKTATLVAVSPAGGVWQFSVARDDAPGFYSIAQILRAGDDPSRAGYEVVSDVRGFDLSGLQDPPDVASPLDAAYSRLQTAVIRFLDTDTPTAGLTVGTSTASYSVAIEGMPLLADLHDYLAGRGVAAIGGDTLVRGAVPCRLRVGLTVYAATTSAAVDATAVARAMADAVNTLGFAGTLYASTLLDAAGAALPADAKIGPLDMLGKIRRPDGTTALIRDPAMLAAPDDPARGATRRTVAFFLDPADVAITTAPLLLPEL